MLVYATTVYLGINALVLLWLLALAFSAVEHAHRVQVSLGGVGRPVNLREIPQEMEGLQDQAVRDLVMLSNAKLLQQQRLLVAGKLSAVSQTLPPRTWITGLSGDRNTRTIRIDAVYLIDPANPYELPAKAWMEALRNDAAFSRDLKRLELEDSSRKIQGSAELFAFRLVAEWNK